ncbi:MAG: outer membrane beta-barrel protein [Bacteroidota bacterium]
MTRFILLLLFVISYTGIQAQVKLGVQLSPTLSFNRIDDDEALVGTGNDGIGGRLMAGILADYMFQENYYVSSGLFFTPKRVGIATTVDTNPVEEAYRLHYLQIPASVKLFTNEVALDTRIYFQAGFTLELKILEDNISDDVTLITDFRPIDSSLLLGTGVEHQFGYSTIVFGGFSYRRGLVNVVKSTNAALGNVVIKNDLFSLDLGVKF